MFVENDNFHFDRAAWNQDAQESATLSLFPWLCAGIQAFLLILLTTNRSIYSMKDIIREPWRQDLTLISPATVNHGKWNVLLENDIFTVVLESNQFKVYEVSAESDVWGV